MMKHHEKSAVVPSVAPSASPVPNGGTLHLSASTPWPVGAGLAKGVTVDQPVREIIAAFREVGANVTRLHNTAKKGLGLWAHKNDSHFVDDHHAVWIAVNAGAQYGVITAPTETWDGFVVVDIDVNDAATEAWAETLPPTPLTVYSRRGRHLWYRAPRRDLSTHCQSLGPTGADGKQHVDFKAGRGLVVGPGSHNMGKNWTYKSNVEITADLLRSLPFYDGGGSFNWDKTADEPAAMDMPTGETGLKFRTESGTVDSSAIPMKWSPIFCPCHPDNVNTPHATARRKRDGTVWVTCWKDKKIYRFRPAPPLTGETAADVLTPEVVNDMAKPMPSELMSSLAAFRQLYWDNHVRSNKLCLGREQALAHEGRMAHVKRRCGQRSCPWCGPHDLAVMASLIGRAFGIDQLYEYTMDSSDFNAWRHAAERKMWAYTHKVVHMGTTAYPPTSLKWASSLDETTGLLIVVANVTTAQTKRTRPARDWKPVAVDVCWYDKIASGLMFTRKAGTPHVTLSLRTSDSVPTEPARKSGWEVVANDVSVGAFLAAAEAVGVPVESRTAITPVVGVDANNDPKWGSIRTDRMDTHTQNLFTILLNPAPSEVVDTTDCNDIVANLFDGTPMPPAPVTPPKPLLPVLAAYPSEWRVPPVPDIEPMADSFEAAVQDYIRQLDEVNYGS